MRRYLFGLFQQKQETQTQDANERANVAPTPPTVTTVSPTTNTDNPAEYNFRYCIDAQGHFIFSRYDEQKGPKVDVHDGVFPNENNEMVFTKETHPIDMAGFLQLCGLTPENPDKILGSFLGDKAGGKMAVSELATGITRDNISQKIQDTMQVFANKSGAIINLIRFDNEDDLKKDLEALHKSAKFNA